jgi:hypothetical protein
MQPTETTFRPGPTDSFILGDPRSIRDSIARSAIDFVPPLNPNAAFPRPTGRITRENYQDMAQARIRQLESQGGPPLTSDERANIIANFAEAAGESWAVRRIDSATNFLGDFFSNLGPELERSYSETARNTGRLVGSAAGAVGDVADNVLGTARLVAIAAAVGGIIFLTRK